LGTSLLRKVQLQIAVNEAFVEPTINAIIKGGRSGEKGEIGDGKIFVLPLEDCIRIRTGERGSERSEAGCGMRVAGCGLRCAMEPGDGDFIVAPLSPDHASRDPAHGSYLLRTGSCSSASTCTGDAQEVEPGHGRAISSIVIGSAVGVMTIASTKMLNTATRHLLR